MKKGAKLKSSENSSRPKEHFCTSFPIVINLLYCACTHLLHRLCYQYVSWLDFLPYHFPVVDGNLDLPPLMAIVITLTSRRKAKQASNWCEGRLPAV